MKPKPKTSSAPYHWKSSNSPREKIQRLGVMNLTNTELITVILGSGSRNLSVFDLAKTVLKSLTKKDPNTVDFSQLIKVAGIGPGKACALLASIEFGKRLANLDIPKVNAPSTVFQLTSEFKTKSREYSVALYLNGRKELIKKQILTIGGQNFNHIEARDLYENALTLPARYVILVHNHPSGDPKPSQEDIELTKILVKAGKILGIEMLDHVIVSRQGYFSFRDSVKK